MSFIVIEGLDGSGKSTQLKLLKEYLNQNKIVFEYLHFPRTKTGMFGDLVARFLRGDLGPNDQVNPYLVGLIYAGDREYSKPLIEEWVQQKKLVIVDRYVHSNMAFQGAKLQTRDEKEALYHWLNELEYQYYKIPKPDICLFLDVPFEFTSKSLQKDRTGDDRDYLQGKKDIHEADLSFQEKVRREYLYMIENNRDLELIKCYDEQWQMLLPNQIFERIISRLKEKQIL